MADTKDVKKKKTKKVNTEKAGAKAEPVQNSEFAENEVLDEETKAQIIKDLTEKASSKKKKSLSYTDVSNRLGARQGSDGRDLRTSDEQGRRGRYGKRA